MKISAILQARMSSQRLPGKVLQPVGGKPLLQYLLERLQRCRSLESIVVATSTDSQDTAIADFCRTRHIPCRRGSLNNVAGRFRNILQSDALDAFVRVNGDSPLLDPRLIDKAVDLFKQNTYDIVTNVQERTFPRGQSVEVIRADAFLRAFPLMKDAADLEHVTRYFYAHPGDFKIFNFKSARPRDGITLAVDAPEDLEMFRAIRSRMTKNHWDYSLDEICDLYETCARHRSPETR